jgi:tRNA nucleotidyltransferase/poly(A) polymerase
MNEIKVYQVGGSIRDEYLGLKSKDIDYSIEAESYDKMKQYIIDSGGTIFLETPKYLTIRANIPNLGATDYVLCRKDGQYHDSRHPESVEIGTIYDDLNRRDFTINAIAKNVDTGEIIDPHNGISDIKNKIIRCVGNPYDRFNEDALRILRAIRFSITKQMSIDYAIINCFYDTKIVNLLYNISKDRVRDELYKCFKFSTHETLKCLEMYWKVRDVLFQNNSFDLWLEPTLKER